MCHDCGFSIVACNSCTSLSIHVPVCTSMAILIVILMLYVVFVWMCPPTTPPYQLPAHMSWYTPASTHIRSSHVVYASHFTNYLHPVSHLYQPYSNTDISDRPVQLHHKMKFMYHNTYWLTIMWPRARVRTICMFDLVLGVWKQWLFPFGQLCVRIQLGDH